MTQWPENRESTSKNVPLCIDCDGTLIHTDLLHESVLLLIKHHPILIFCLPFWLLRGKAYLKTRISALITFNWSTLPYCLELIEYIQDARTCGRKVVLCTASPIRWATGISNYLKLFDEVIATDTTINLEGENKASRLLTIYGHKLFDYAGNSSSDFPVWKNCRKVICVSNKLSLKNQVNKLSKTVLFIEPVKAKATHYLKAIRLHQWLKNALVFVPLIAAHQLNSLTEIYEATIAFVAFGLCASSVYILNDLLDLESDRLHIRKRNRPFASSILPIWQGIFMIPVLLAVSALLSIQLPPYFFLSLIFYYALTLAYSIRLKRQVVVDVMLLAALYTMRIIAGASSVKIMPSFWLLAFSMFVFLSLALVKRYSELLITLKQEKTNSSGRGYFTSDLQVLLSLGSSSGIAAIMVLALYINDPSSINLYPNKVWLWPIPVAMLYWITRIWMKACRGEVDDDPVVFAAKDWQSLVIVIVLALCFTLASLNN